MAVHNDLGVFQRHNDHIEVRFERRYPRPVQTVWSALTEPARLADWMGVAHVEPFVGGRFELMGEGPHPMTGKVLAWEPPRLLEFTWSNTHAPDSVVRYELTPEGTGTLLVFTHQGMPYQNSALMLPGWHDFLARLARTLEGSDTPHPPGFWRQMQAIYVEHYDLHDVTLNP